MAKWREESGKAIKATDEESEAATEADPATRAKPEPAGSQSTRHRPRTLRTHVRRASDAAAGLVRILAMIICVLLALHIAFAVFSANPDNAIVRTVNDWSDWFAWRFRDMFVPKDERLGVLVNYGIAAVVYLITGRVVASLIRRIR